MQKESVSPPAPSTTTVTSNSTSATTAGNAQTGAVTNIIKHDFIMKTNDAWSGDEAVLEANGIRPRKPCNCTKSMCLKLYVLFVYIILFLKKGLYNSTRTYSNI